MNMTDVTNVYHVIKTQRTSLLCLRYLRQLRYVFDGAIDNCCVHWCNVI